MTLTAEVWREEPWYVARCVEIAVVSQGETADEATENLREALAIAAGGARSGEDADFRSVDVLDDPPRERRGGVPVAVLVRQLELRGWRVERARRHLVLRHADRLVVVPAFFEIAPGVYRSITDTVGEDVLADAPVERGPLARLDALFASHPHRDDTTSLIRAQRDAG